MSYECPLEIISMPLEIMESEISKMARDIAEGVESHVMATVRTHVNVDKDELIRALNYDRDQYHKGYSDGKFDALNSMVHCKDCEYFEECKYDFSKADGICFYWNCHATVKDGFCFKGKVKVEE